MTSRRAVAARLVRAVEGPLDARREAAQSPNPGRFAYEAPEGTCSGPSSCRLAHCVRDHHWHGRHDDEEVESD